MRRMRVAAFLTAGLMAGLVLAACGDSSTGGGGDTGVTVDATDAADTAGADTAPADVADVPDTEAPDGSGDTGEDDAGDAAPDGTICGELGCPCGSGADCFSGYCVRNYDGNVCTTGCVDTCPEGWSCLQFGPPGTDSAFVCLPDFARLCYPCRTDDDCEYLGLSGGAVCIDRGLEGRYCGGGCAGKSCPEGFACETVTSVTGQASEQCVPAAGACGCTAPAVEDGADTVCTWTNEAGTCFGERACGAEGLSACTAAEPAPEACNGLDDDCDGGTDEAFPDLLTACDGDDGDQCADGEVVCAEDGAGTVCDEPADGGKVELCNALDDDCDGETDEDFPTKGDPCDGEDDDACANGVLTCTADLLGVSCDEKGPSVKELCNGADDDCDGETDEGFPDLGEPCDGPDADGCENGTWVCSPGGGDRVCEGDVEAQAFEVCDGYDNDCNGATDDGFDLGVACGQGACADGVTECTSDGKGVRCTTEAGGSDDASGPELCNGADDDCDGTTDDGFDVGAACGKGACAGGKKECLPDGTGTRCSTEAGGTADASGVEVCNGLDDDCNGVTDEGFDVGAACGVGACAGGKKECLPDGTGTRCSTEAGGTADASGPEVCNGVDDDCNGTKDDGFDAGFACGVGACAGGTKECLPDGTGTRCSTEAGGTADASGPEVCNGADDDCNGTKDDGFDVGFPCGVGACAGGKRECLPDGTGTRCSTEAGGTADASGPEVCNGADDDCNGTKDDGFDVGAACGVGACAGGAKVCTADGLATVCTTAPGGPQDASGPETCNAKDDDCDGLTDDGDVCPCPVEVYDGETFLFCAGESRNWFAAQTFCEVRGYHLLTITSAAKDLWVHATVEDYDPYDGANQKANAWWMGFNDLGEEGVWVWEDATPTSYTNWFEGEPNNLFHGDAPATFDPYEHCGQVRFFPSPGWNDEPCWLTYPFVCQVK